VVLDHVYEGYDQDFWEYGHEDWTTHTKISSTLSHNAVLFVIACELWLYSSSTRYPIIRFKRRFLILMFTIPRAPSECNHTPGIWYIDSTCTSQHNAMLHVRTWSQWLRAQYTLWRSRTNSALLIILAWWTRTASKSIVCSQADRS